MIYLMRHGADDDTRLGGWSDAGLSPLGVDQVKQASEKIAQGGYNIERIYSIDLPRAKETADIIAKALGLKVIFIKEFRETNNGILAGIQKEKARAEFPGLYWSTLEWEQSYPNGESPAEFFGRIESAWQSFRKQADAMPGNTLLVTHGGVIDAILCIENGKEYTNKHVTFQTAHAAMVCVP